MFRITSLTIPKPSLNDWKCTKVELKIENAKNKEHMSLTQAFYSDLFTRENLVNYTNGGKIIG